MGGGVGEKWQNVGEKEFNGMSGEAVECANEVLICQYIVLYKVMLFINSSNLASSCKYIKSFVTFVSFPIIQIIICDTLLNCWPLIIFQSFFVF